MNSIKTKRIYDVPAKSDGYRILVDRVWPRGVSKSKAALDEWNKNLAPSEGLRKWFNHDDKKFEAFSQRYQRELLRVEDELKRILELAKDQQVCLVYGAKNKDFNQAVVLQTVLTAKIHKEGYGPAL